MQTVTVKDLTLGTGIPKICVPIVGITEQEILKSAQEIRRSQADFAEWRADWFAQAKDFQKVHDILTKLRSILERMPLLCTFRTSQEGGEQTIARSEYIDFNTSVIQTRLADLIDIELSAGDTAVKQLVAAAHKQKIAVIASNHDFYGTPSKEEIIQRLCHMQKLGADLVKIAVMPQNRSDVLTLLAATEQMNREHADCPVITMAMGAIGVISRISAEAFGSAVTFAAAGKASAPGQIQVEELSQILSILHQNM